MPVDNNALRSVMQDKSEMVLFKDARIIPEMMYELICEEDYVYPLGGKVYFTAGVPTKVNGLFAKNIVRMTRGKVQFVDKSLWLDKTADANRDQEIADLKATVASLLKQQTKPEVKATPDEVIVSKPAFKKVAKKATKKILTKEE